MFLSKKNETLPSKGKFVSVRFAELAQNESFTASLACGGLSARQLLNLKLSRKPDIALNPSSAPRDSARFLEAPQLHEHPGIRGLQADRGNLVRSLKEVG